LSLTFLSLLAARRASAQDTWAIDRPAVQDVSPGTAETFRQILRTKISAGGVRTVDLSSGCPDAQCARAAAAPTGAQVVVFGSLGRLGTKIVVSLSAVEVPSGAAVGSDAMSVDRVEELDLAAARMADALLSGSDVEGSAELGTLTHAETDRPTRRDLRVGVSLALEGIAPLDGYADRATGAGFMLGVWFEALDFAIQPSFGWRTELGAGDRDWDHIPLELSAAWLILRSDISPVIGGGVGLHYMHEEVPVRREVGSILVSTSRDVIEDSVFGFSAFARAGLLLLRTYDVSLLIALDYAASFADFEERDGEQALRLSVAVILGGS
jgi:hypothetical protein